MKLSSKELKRRSRETLTGHYGTPMLAFVIMELIILIINSPFQLSLQNNPGTFQTVISLLASLIISLITVVLSAGHTYIHINLARKKEARLSDLFYFFTKRPDRFILSGLLLFLIFLPIMLPAIICTNMALFRNTPSLYITCVFLWAVTIIPVVYLSLSYQLVTYLLIEQPDDRIIDVFRESRHLMKGQKGRLLYLSLSFIGMSLLAICSFGIGFLWVNPYQSQTLIAFYRNVTGEID